MSTDLFGGVAIDRLMSSDELWLCETFSRGQAWMDLILLANTAPKAIRVRGNRVMIERGQVGWSIVRLAARWKWSTEKATRFLNELHDLRKIAFKPSKLSTVVTILGYCDLNGKHRTDSATEPETKPVSETVTDSATEPALRGKREEGRGKEEPAGKNYPSLDRAVEVFGSMANHGYQTAEIQGAWHELTAGAVDGHWMTGRPLRPVADWRSALMSELWKRRQVYGQNNGAPKMGMWHLKEKLAALRARIEEHPANDQSGIYVAEDVTPEEDEDLRRLRQETEAVEREMRGFEVVEK